MEARRSEKTALLEDNQETDTACLTERERRCIGKVTGGSMILGGFGGISCSIILLFMLSPLQNDSGVDPASLLLGGFVLGILAGGGAGAAISTACVPLTRCYASLFYKEEAETRQAPNQEPEYNIEGGMRSRSA